MTRRWQRLAALALSALMLGGCMELLDAPLISVGFLGATVPPGFQPDGNAFVFSDPPMDNRFGTDDIKIKVGLMHPSGVVVVPAQYDSGYRVDEGDDAGVMLFVFTRYAVTDAGTTSTAYLLDGNGKILTEGSYTQFTTAGDLVVGERYETTGDNNWTQHFDVLERTGEIVKKDAFQGFLHPFPGGFLTESVAESVADAGDGMTYSFYDERATLLETKELLELRYGAEEDGAPLLFPFRPIEGDAMGYLDARGEVAIEPRFLDARNFRSNGYAHVRLADGRETLINQNGEEVLSEDYQVVQNIPGMLHVTEGKAQVLLDGDFEKIASTEASVDINLYGYGDGGAYAIAREGDKQTLVLSDGRTFDLPGDASPMTMDGRSFLLQTEEGLRLLDTQTEATVDVEGTWGFIPDEDHFIIQNIDNTNTLYDKAGNPLLSANSVAPDGYGRWLISQERFGQLRYGVVDDDGTELLPIEHAELTPMYDAELYRARKGNTTGYIDKHGDWVYRISVYSRPMD
jgi:hypothetical protein